MIRIIRIIWIAFFFGIIQKPTCFGADKVTLQLKWDHEFQFAGYYAALWNGYYQDASLDVTLRSRVSENGTLMDVGEELESGRAEFAVTGPDLLIYRDRGIEVVIIATIFQQSPYGFVTLKDRFTTPAQFAGKRVCQAEPSWGPVELDAVMRAVGGDYNSVRISDQPPHIQLLLSDQVDVVATYLTSAIWQMEEMGMRNEFKTFSAADFGVYLYGDTLVTHQRLIDRRPSLVERFTEASLRGWRYALSNTDEIAERIASDLPRTFKFYNDFEAYNKHEAKDIVKLTNYPTVSPGHTSVERWQKTLEYFQQAGHVESAIDIDKVIFQPERIRRERYESVTRTLSIIASASGIVIVFLFAWSRTLGSRVKEKTRELQELNNTLEKRVQMRTKALEEAKIRAEAAAHAKSEFLANMSHEIRTPMNAVIGFTDILKETEPREDQREPLRLIHDNAQTLLTVIDDVLEMSKLDSRDIELQQAPFNVVELVGDLAAQIRNKLADKPVEFHCKTDDFNPLRVGDAARIRQVLLHILGNAVKFTDNGTIELIVREASNQRSKDQTNNGDRLDDDRDAHVSFLIRDTGVGIPADSLDKIFNPFEQVDSSTTRRFGGMGLGLSLGRKLADLMDGTIEVESEVGRGSTFTLTLKLEKAEGNADRRQPSES